MGPKWGGPCERVCRRGWHSGGGRRDGGQSTQNKGKKGTQLFTPLQKAQAHCRMCIWCRRRCLLSVCWLNGAVGGTAVGGGAVGGIVMLFLLISVLLKSEGRTGSPSRLRVATRVKSRLLEPRLFPRIGPVSPVAKRPASACRAGFQPSRGNTKEEFITSQPSKEATHSQNNHLFFPKSKQQSTKASIFLLTLPQLLLFIPSHPSKPQWQHNRRKLMSLLDKVDRKHKESMSSLTLSMVLLKGTHHPSSLEIGAQPESL